MDYVKEMKAFYDLLETNPLSAAAIALCHALMHMNDKVGWVESFTVAVPVLCYKSGLEEGVMVKARQELVDKGFVRVRSHSDQLLSVYTLVSIEKHKQTFVPAPETELEEKAEPESKGKPESKSDSIPKSVPTQESSVSQSASEPATLSVSVSTPEDRHEQDHQASEEMNATANCQLKASIKKVEFLNKTKKKREQSFVRIVLNDMELHHDQLIDWNRLRPGEHVTVSLDIGQTCPEQIGEAGANQNGKAKQPIEEWITIIEGDPELKEGERIIEEFTF